MIHANICVVAKYTEIYSIIYYIRIFLSHTSQSSIPESNRPAFCQGWRVIL